MRYQAKEMFRYSAGSLGILAALALSGAVSHAAYAAPPMHRDCNSDFPSDQFNDRLDCKTENVNEALYRYIDAAIELDTVGQSLGRSPIFSESQVQSMMAGRERAQNAKGRAHDAELFRGSVKKQKRVEDDCYIKEIIGDMGGPHGGNDIQPCEAGENCEEVIGDGIGDDDGICEMHGPHREVCTQVCQQPVQDDEDNYDPNIAADTEQDLDEVETVINDATTAIDEATAKMRAAYASRPPGFDATDCDQYLYGRFPGPAVLQATQIAKNITGAAFNGCSVTCNQDAFGWNCEAACLGLAIIDGIANGINDGFSVADNKNSSEQADHMARCTTQLHTEVGSISTAVNGNQASLDEVTLRLAEVSAKLDSLTEQLNTLASVMAGRFDSVDNQLCTPQGQRACFPIVQQP
jgi:hypothetical protein